MRYFHSNERSFKFQATAPIPSSFGNVTSKETKEQTLAVKTPTTPNRGVLTKDNNFTQTKLTFADLGKITINLESNTKTDDYGYKVVNADNELKSLTLNNNKHLDPIYRSALSNDVHNWEHKLSMYRNEDVTIQERDRALNILIDDIRALAPRVDGIDYDSFISNAIENALRKIKLKYPIGYEKEFDIKKDLHDNLLARIQDTNKIVLGIMPRINLNSSSSRKDSQTERRESSTMDRKVGLSTGKRESGGRETLSLNREGSINSEYRRSRSPSSVFVARREKTESTITLGKDRKKSASMNSLGDLSTFGGRPSFSYDDEHDFGTIVVENEENGPKKYLSDDVSSGYTGNVEDDSTEASIIAGARVSADTAYMNARQSKVIHECDMLNKKNEELRINTIRFMGQKDGKKLSRHNSANTRKRTIQSASMNQETTQTTDPYSQEMCQRKRGLSSPLISQKPYMCAKSLQGQGKHSGDLRRELEFEIFNWMSLMNITKHHTQTSKQDITNAVMDSLAEYKSNEEINNVSIKAKIAGILKDFGIEVNTDNLPLAVDKMIVKLANKLIDVKKRTEFSNISDLKRLVKKSFPDIDYFTVKHNIVYKNQLKHNLILEIEKCLKETKANYDVFNEIAEVLISNTNSIESRNYKDTLNDILIILKVTGNSDDYCNELAARIIENTKHVLAMACNITENNILDTLSTSFEKYSSEIDLCEPCPCNSLEEGEPSYNVNTSTLKIRRNKTDINALSVNEKAFIDKIAEIVEKWFDKVGNFNQEENKELKDMMLYDLAGEIVDHKKLNQLAPHSYINQDQFMHYHINKWLIKFEIFDNVHQGKAVVNELVKQLQIIDVPDLTKPRSDLRQPTEKAKQIESDNSCVEELALKNSYVLKDDIYNWLNEQGSKVFYNTSLLDENIQNFIHDLATQIQPLLGNKDERNIKNITENFLTILLEPKEKADIKAMAKDLCNRVIKLPQHTKTAKAKTIQERIEKRVSQEMEDVIQKNIEQSKNLEIRLAMQKKWIRKKNVESKETTQDVSTEVEIDTETTMKEYILKYIQLNYEVDDVMIRGTYAQLLKTELQKLGAETGKVKEKGEYDNFSPQNLDKELQYVKAISDWLKNLPINGSYNVLGNKNRIEFISYLAKNIVRLEDERVKNPDAVDYNLYLGNIITQFTEQLPLLPDTDADNIKYVVDQLLTKIDARRNRAIRYSQANEPKLIDFIDQYVRVEGKEIAGDELKLEAWSARLLEEIQKIVYEPDTTCCLLNKSNTYRKLSFAPASGNETVERFQQELKIAKEIIDWLKNLPLLESKFDILVLLASDLAQKLCAFEANSSDSQIKEELNDYLDYWFKQLPLNKKHEVDKPMAVKQLLNRVRKLTDNKNSKEEKQRRSLSFDQSTQFTEKKGKAQKNKPKKLSKEESDPGQRLLQAIDHWCRNLSFDGGNPEARKTARNNIATKLYLKVSKLNDESRINEDNGMFIREIGFEMENVLQDLPETLKLKGDRNALRQSLLMKLDNARSEIVPIVAGDHYKATLNATLDSSLPKSTPAVQDPGYDMYKNKLTDIFILENFDYSTNEPNRKYKIRIKDKINQLSQKRNSVPLSKEKIYNELYSSMYKVPIPNKNIVIDKVEEIKTRCEIDSWFDELPVRPPQDLEELKRWDQILNTLAKRIHYIEKVNTNPEEKIHKEITKLLVQFPLLQGNVDNLAKLLVTKLRISEKSRKCVVSDDYVQEAINIKTYTTVPLSDDQLEHIKTNDCKKRGVDIMADVVENWCSKLPIAAFIVEEENSIRDGIVTDILKKLSELNSDPQVFDADILYDHFINKELDRILKKLPQNSVLENKELRKEELIQAIKQARNILKEERIRHYYVEDLKLVVFSTLPMPQNNKLEYDAMYDHTIDKIVSNFIEYAYNRDDEEAKHFYMSKIFKNFRKYITEVKDETDSLVITNITVCDMAKLSIPKDYILREEIDEIRMRNEVKEFIRDILPRQNSELKDITTNQQINCLTKLLCKIEKCGHNVANESEMKKQVLKTINKLKQGTDDVEKKINDFIVRLRESEPFRKAYPFRKAEDLPTRCQTVGVQPSEDYVHCGCSCIVMGYSNQPHQESKMVQKNTIDFSNINTGHPAPFSQIKPNIGDIWHNQYTPNNINSPSGSFLAMGGQDQEPNNIAKMNKTVEYPNFGLKFSAVSTPHAKDYVPSSLPITANNSDRLLICHPTEGTIEQCHLSKSGADLQHQNVSAIIHDPLMIANPAEGSVQPWTSTASGAQLKVQNISAQIHNAPGPDISFQPFPRPPGPDFTDTSTIPRVYVPYPMSTAPPIDGSCCQPFSIVPPETDLTLASDQVSSTLPSDKKNQGTELPLHNPPDCKEALSPRRLSRRVSIKEPFGAPGPLNSPELILNTQNLKSPAVPSPIPTSLAVPGHAHTPNPVETSPGAGLVSTGTAVSGSACTSNVLEKSGFVAPVPMSEKATALATESTPVQGQYGQQQGIASDFTTDASTDADCIPCSKYFQKRRSPCNCVGPVCSINALRSCCPCLQLKDSFVHGRKNRANINNPAVFNVNVFSYFETEKRDAQLSQTEFTGNRQNFYIPDSSDARHHLRAFRVLEYEANCDDTLPYFNSIPYSFGI